MKIYHNQNCSKSCASLTALNNSGQSFELIEYLSNPPSKYELIELLEKLDMPAFELIRKGELIFKTHFGEKEMSEQEAIDAMVQFPILIQRPIVVNGNKAVIGRPIENVMNLLKVE